MPADREMTRESDDIEDTTRSDAIISKTRCRLLVIVKPARDNRMQLSRVCLVSRPGSMLFRINWSYRTDCYDRLYFSDLRRDVRTRNVHVGKSGTVFHVRHISCGDRIYPQTLFHFI